jgi:hypothetical protein
MNDNQKEILKACQREANSDHELLILQPLVDSLKAIQPKDAAIIITHLFVDNENEREYHLAKCLLEELEHLPGDWFDLMMSSNPKLLLIY